MKKAIVVSARFLVGQRFSLNVYVQFEGRMYHVAVDDPDLGSFMVSYAHVASQVELLTGEWLFPTEDLDKIVRWVRSVNG